MQPASHEVPARIVWAVVRTVERAGLSADALFDGLSFDRETLHTMRRVPWVDYAIVCENTRIIAGGDTGLEDLLESGYHEAIPELRALAAVFVEPKRFLRFVVEVVNPLGWPPVQMTCTDLGGRDLRVECRTRPGAAPNRAFFQGSVGSVRGAPRHLDLPSAEMLHVEVGDTYGIYELRVPVPRSRGAGLRRLSRMLLRRVTEPLTLGFAFTDLLEERLEDAAVDWELTPRQADVLRRLVQGRANKEIAQSLGVAENTVELHVTQLLKKAEAQSRAQLIARFWSD